VEPGVLHPLDHQLRDAVTAQEADRLGSVRVQHRDLDLAPVSGVHRPRRVDDRYPVPGRKAGSRVNEGGVACGQRYRQSGGNDGALARGQFNIGGRDQIGSGIPWVRVPGQRHSRVQAPDQHVRPAVTAALLISFHCVHPQTLHRDVLVTEAVCLNRLAARPPGHRGRVRPPAQLGPGARDSGGGGHGDDGAGDAAQHPADGEYR